MSLRALLAPRSVAVVGASHDPAKLGHVLLRNVVEYGFAGEVYPVNPAGGEILGRRVWPSVGALPAPPDLVLVSVPNRAVPEVIAQAAARRARAAVILASGFGEMAGDGAALQRQVLAARRAGMRILGPNCMGVVNLPARLNASYFWDVPRAPGALTFVSQSGAYGGLVMSELRRRGMGLARFVSIGNQADVTHADVLEEIARGGARGVVALFIEEVRDGRRFLAACAAVARRAPVVAMKVGRTAAGRRAAESHTGSLAGDAEVCDAALRQAGAVVARSTDDFFDALLALDAYPRARPRPAGLAIVTISGGPCVAAGDACEEAGIPVPELSARTQARVRRLIPEFGAARNPVDMTPQMRADRFVRCVDAVASDPRIGGLLAINVGLDRPEYAEAFVRARARHKKPVVAFVVDDPTIERRFREAGIPIFGSPERAVRGYAALRQRRRPAVRDVRLPPERPGPTVAWDEDRSRRFLARHGLPVCRGEPARGAREAREVARRIGYPVVVKALGGGPHRTERGGVVLGVRTPEELAVVVARVGPRVLVEEQVGPGHELLVGGRRDPTFGPVVVLGSGGIWTEHVRDVSMRVAPIGLAEARAMIAETKAGARLGGARGLPAADAGVVARLLAAVSRLLVARPQIREVEMNPVIAVGRRAVAVDALVVALRRAR